MVDNMLVPFSDPPANAWWDRLILWAHHHAAEERGTRRLIPGESLVSVASEAMRRWQESTDATERAGFFANLTRFSILEHLGDRPHRCYRLHRRILSSMWDAAKLRAPCLFAPLGSGAATCWAHEPFNLGKPTLRGPKGCSPMLMWGELFDEWRDKMRRGAMTRPRPENPDHHPWRHSMLAMVGLQPFFHIPRGLDSGLQPLCSVGLQDSTPECLPLRILVK